MKITLYGAAGTETGSAYYLRSANASILVDLGVFQGEKAQESRNNKLPPVDIASQ